MEERSREHFTMLRCVIHHQCNTERSGDGRKVQGTFYNVEVRSIISVTRSGAEMEERSRELFTMLRCVIHHQCNA